MPILHTQLNGMGTGPNGQSVQVPPPPLLVQRGPCVQVSISIAQSMSQQLIQQGASLPVPVSGLALIDTGASSTCIDDAIAEQLGVPAIDVVTMHSASHAGHPANIYPVRFEVNGLPISLDVPRAMGAALASQGLAMLIGRDVLQFCTLFYNGMSGAFTLSI